LRIIYGSWDPRHAGSPVNTAGLVQIALLLIHHAALQRCCFYNRTFSSFPRSPAPFVLHHLSPLSYYLLPEAGLINHYQPRTLFPPPPSHSLLPSPHPLHFHLSSPSLLSASSLPRSSTAMGPSRGWRGPARVHPYHPLPHAFSLIYLAPPPLANTHYVSSTLQGLAPVPPSPSRHIRVHTAPLPAASV